MAPAAEKAKEAAASAVASRIALKIDAPVARITLQHSPLNVIDLQMMDELSAALAEIETRDDVSIVVLEGSEKAFSAGVDVAAHTPDKVEEMLRKFHASIVKLAAMKKVTMAAVRGHCLGGGAELAMVCDLVFTTGDALWGFPEIKLACFPPVAATALAALIGQKHAADLILTGRTISGEESASLGLANQAVSGADLDVVLQAAIDRVSKLSPAAIAVTKKAIYAWDSIHFDKGLARAEKVYLEELTKVEDMREGVNAFLEKREANWKGK
ncbi:MAG TPA: enoyl-CoA hydratase/isomerase family protein [Terriglobales bacterium]|nr:enoyl-CoA hydratase/isomerase family protein [Terriglobales bacterium]